LAVFQRKVFQVRLPWLALTEIEPRHRINNQVVTFKTIFEWENYIFIFQSGWYHGKLISPLFLRLIIVAIKELARFFILPDCYKIYI
jgi:hypothetical protein